MLQLKSYKSRQQRCGIELADDGFDDHEARLKRKHHSRDRDGTPNRSREQNKNSVPFVEGSKFK